jgi:sarcosine oxidase / L-pipecolate oxidase
VNKIIRAAYGSKLEYQNMAFDAIEHWKQWNAEIESGQDLPPGMSAKDTLFINNGNVSMTDEPGPALFEQATRESMAKAGKGDTQITLEDPEDVARAKSLGFGHAVNPFGRKDNYGTLDTCAGVVYADKACRFALHKVMRLGVKTIFGPEGGAYSGLLEKDGRVRGIRTVDGKEHQAALTIMACGGWTPGLIPQLDGLCETTAGSVATFQIPRTSHLWDRLDPRRFPVWT